MYFLFFFPPPDPILPPPAALLAAPGEQAGGGADRHLPGHVRRERGRQEQVLPGQEHHGEQLQQRHGRGGRRGGVGACACAGARAGAGGVGAAAPRAVGGAVGGQGGAQRQEPRRGGGVPQGHGQAAPPEGRPREFSATELPSLSRNARKTTSVHYGQISKDFKSVSKLLKICQIFHVANRNVPVGNTGE